MEEDLNIFLFDLILVSVLLQNIIGALKMTVNQCYHSHSSHGEVNFIIFKAPWTLESLIFVSNRMSSGVGNHSLLATM
jgi:hypothetical protein